MPCCFTCARLKPCASSSTTGRASVRVGVVCNVAIDQITGYGAFTAWNWSIANGLAGLLAGIIPVAIGVRFGSNKIVTAAIVAALSTIIGFVFVFTDIWVFGTAPATALTGSYIPVVIANVISSVILTPILVAVWGPIQEQIGR